MIARTTLAKMVGLAKIKSTDILANANQAGPETNANVNELAIKDIF